MISARICCVWYVSNILNVSHFPLCAAASVWLIHPRVCDSPANLAI